MHESIIICHTKSVQYIMTMLYIPYITVNQTDRP